MSKLPRPLPPLAHLAAFEAAARHGNFSHAARDLGVSQAAVSMGIRALEDMLATPLFRRAHRGVELTVAGLALSKDVASGLGQIREGLERIRPQGGRHVTLSVSTAFANYWLLPRLTGLRQAHPDIELRIVTTDRDIDIALEGIALSVSYGRGVFAHYRTAPLAREIIYPVCAPAYLPQVEARRRDAGGDLTLIHLDEPHRPCPDWSQWIAAVPEAGALYRSKSGIRINDYALVIQAVLEGQGVALGWSHLLDRMVARGLLVRTEAAAWDTGTDFQVCWMDTLTASGRQVRDWLLAEGAMAAPVASPTLTG